MDNCENWAIGKMRQKNVKKGPKEKSSKQGFCFYIDIAFSKFTSAGGSKYWFLAVDETTHMKFSIFLKQKSDVKEKFIPFLKELQDTYVRCVHHIRCYNAGENQALENVCTRNISTKWRCGKIICDNIRKNKGNNEQCRT